MNNREFWTGVLYTMGFTALFFMIISLSAKLYSPGNATPPPPPLSAWAWDSPSPSPRVSLHGAAVVESNDHNMIFNNNSSSIKSGAIFVIGDSAVDCAENALFYPILRHNLSLIPCSNGSNSTLIHHFLGIFSYLSSAFTNYFSLNLFVLANFYVGFLICFMGYNLQEC